MEPPVQNGRGMRLLGFVPAAGLSSMKLRTVPLRHVPSGTKRKRNTEADVAISPADSTTASTASSSNTVRGPSSWKKGRPVYERGNYASYYGYRQADVDAAGLDAHDLRLAAVTKCLGPHVFHGLEVLDVGCNDGSVSIQMALKHGARRVVGIDVDANLIDVARANKKRAVEVHDGCEANIKFRADDILEIPLKRGPSMKAERFDAILCFSVTKWIHFAYGDAGIRNLFRRCWKRLRPGGFFILEPQDWASYKKKRHITRDIREMVASIELKPEEFEKCLVEMFGFQKVETLDPPRTATGGFKRRPILIFKRPDSDSA
eukprot:TRINITY_DN41364_c0_g1_i2.p1 TRINITY_DN41364_c0_g1~~TRINITY_DN41364_c0_g1_i2.p1  ORF type:complete len:318 (+),score=42.75 TRINITY_DN41364_c0_g1_i2:70-1023(+)